MALDLEQQRFRESLEPILDQLLRKTHANTKRVLFQTAVPYWVNPEMLGEIVPRSQGKESRILVELSRKYSFIFASESQTTGQVNYLVNEIERAYFNEQFIKSDHDPYLKTHAAAFHYWDNHAVDQAPLIRSRNRFYHRLFVDCPEGMSDLQDLTRTWLNDREFTALEHLIESAEEAFGYLQLLDQEGKLPQEKRWPIKLLGQMITIINARLARRREDLDDLRALLSQFGPDGKDALPEVRPYLALLEGYLELDQNRYAAAIAHFQTSIRSFETLEIESEILDHHAGRAEAQIALGTAYTGLSNKIGGNRTAPSRPARGPLACVGHFLQFLISLPLVFFISRILGRRAYHPDNWHIFEDADWVRTSFFANGVKYYAAAGRQLKQLISQNPDLDHRLSSLTESSDEQLGYLLLDLGDASAAYDQLETILREGSPGRYRTADIQVGQADALIRMGRHSEAKALLQVALPVIQEFKVPGREGDAQALLGEIHEYESEALLADGKHQLAREARQEGIEAYRASYLRHVKANNLTQGTAAWSNLDRLTHKEEALEGESDQKLVYSYRYRHPLTRRLRRLIVVLFSVASFLGSTLLFRLGNQSTVSPELTFQASPILNPNSTLLDINLNSAGTLVFNPFASVQPQALLGWILILTTAYFLGMTAYGWFTISRIDPQTIEADVDNKGITLTPTGIQLTAKSKTQPDEADSGDDAEPEIIKSIDFSAIQSILRADQAIIRDRLQDESVTFVSDGSKQIPLEGNLIGYDDLVERVIKAAKTDRAPGSEPNIRDIGYAYLFSWSGLLYYVTLFFFLITSFLAFLGFNLLLDDPILGRYSIIDIYPWIFLGLFIPTVWWFVIKPTQILQHYNEWRPFPLYLLGTGVLFFCLIFVRANLNLRTYPDIYIPLACLICLSCGTYLFTTFWRPQNRLMEQITFPSVMILAVILSISVSFYLLREVRMYHNQVLGNSYRDELIRSDGQNNGQLLTLANHHYTQAILFAEEHFLGIDTNRSIKADLYGNRGLMQLGLSNDAQLGTGSEVLPPQSNPETLRNSESIDDVSIITDSRIEISQPIEDFAAYDAAIADFTRAAELIPNEPRYILWRAYVHQSKEDLDAAKADYEETLALSREAPPNRKLSRGQTIRTLTGLGWVNIQDEAFEIAETWFKTATDLYIAPDDQIENPESPTRMARFTADAYLGLGYALYFDDTGRYPIPDQYLLARDAWERSTELDATDPLAFINLGASYWRLSKERQDPNLDESALEQESANRCFRVYPEQTREIAEGYLNQAEAILIQSLPLGEQSPQEQGFTYRTLGQIAFLQGSCPSTVSEQAYLKAIDYYSEAITLDPANSHYYHMRGRLSYTAWFVSTGSGASARIVLMDGLDDAKRSVDLNPDGPNYALWLTRIEREAVSGSLQKGNEALEDGNFERAQGYFDLVSDRVLENTEAPFLAANVRLQAGALSEAVALYDSAIKRALAGDDEDAVINAYNSLPLNAPQEIFDRFETLAIDLDQPTTAEEAFNRALRAYIDGDDDAGIPLFRLGLEYAKQEGNLSPIRAGILNLLKADTSRPIDPYLALVTDDIEALRVVAAADDASSLAFDLGFLGLAINDIEVATIGYNEGIRRTTLSPFGPLAATEGQLFSLWQETGRGSQAGELLEAIQADLPGHLRIYPELVNDGNFWRYRGWFKYYLGSAAFRVGEERIADAALRSGQPDADQANAFGRPGSLDIHTYLPQGARGWYHLLRGDDLRQEARLAEALETYLAGGEAYREDIDPSNINQAAADELLLIRLRAIETALQIGALDIADDELERLVEDIDTFDAGLNLTRAIDNLNIVDLPDGSARDQARQRFIEILIEKNEQN